MMMQLDSPLPLETPKGKAWAHFLIDRGAEHHLYWVTFIEATGECWTFENPDIRMQHNLTLGHPKKAYVWRPHWKEEQNEERIHKAKSSEEDQEKR